MKRHKIKIITFRHIAKPIMSAEELNRNLRDYHGTHCPKVRHKPDGGYLHFASDDTPYGMALSTAVDVIG